MRVSWLVLLPLATLSAPALAAPEGEDAPSFSTLAVDDPAEPDPAGESSDPAHNHRFFRELPPLVSGGLTRADVAPVIEQHWSEIAGCYPRGGDKDSGGPAITAHVQIGPSGQVVLADAEQVDSAETATSKCVLSRVKRWTFPRPHGGGARLDHVFVLGGLAKSEVRNAIRQRSGTLKHCASGGPAAQKTGKVSVSFNVSPKGTVSAARIKASSVNDEGVERCVLAAIRQWTFPKPRGGGYVTVNDSFAAADLR